MVRRIFAAVKADDNDVDMCFAARVRAPFKGAVGEGDFEVVTVEQQGPELGDLFALGYGIGGDEGDAGGGVRSGA